MKKIILFLVIVIYLAFALSSPIILAEDSTENNGESGLFTPEIEFEVSEFNEVIEPSVSKDITVKVKFRLNLDSIGKRFLFNRRIGRAIIFGFAYFFKVINKLPKANLTLLVEAPDGCQAELEKEEIELDYNNEFEVAEVRLTITLDKDSTAFQKMDVNIKANYPGQGRIAAYSNNTSISFMPKYESNLSVDIESDINIPPLKETIVPINITNNGNGRSSVSIMINTFDQENWNISFNQDEVTIDVGKTKLVNMNVKPPKEFDNVPLILTFVPTSTVENVDESYRQGTSVDSSITFYNDGSLEYDEELDLTMIIIIAIVVLIVIVLVSFIIKKRK